MGPGTSLHGAINITLQQGVEIVGPGILWNDGYKFQGKEITTTEADRLAFFTYYNNRPANSIQEAKEFWDDFEPGV